MRPANKNKELLQDILLFIARVLVMAWFIMGVLVYFLSFNIGAIVAFFSLVGLSIIFFWLAKKVKPD